MKGVVQGQRIGPYRIERLLGSGGMGAVYLAVDERLERRVALKRIRSGSADDAVGRRRFRREAKAAAGLVHPAIVQVHDIVSSDQGEWIVFEYVAGAGLDRVLAEGPLPLPIGMNIAIQIAEGLAAAHEHGIVHRDLKAENVIVGHTGAVKISDFGLARRWTGEATAGGPLTGDGDILGTLRSMSPEQSRGLPVDPRSDLFALGVLFYEVFTGVSPFRAPTPANTLDKIRRHMQIPAHERAQVPRALSALIDCLLEKSPSRRPGSAREVVASLRDLAATQLQEPPTPAALQATTIGASDEPSVAFSAVLGDVSAVAPPRRTIGSRRSRLIAAAVAVLGATGAGSWWLLDEVPYRYVAVAVPEIELAEAKEEAALIRTAAEIGLFEGLLAFDRTAPLEAVDRRHRPPLEIARSLAADEAIATRIACQARSCSVTLRRLRAADGMVLWTDSFEAPRDDRYLLTMAIVRRIAAAFPERRRRGAVRRQAVDGADYDTFLRLRQAYEDRSLSAGQLLEAASALRRKARRFPEAYRLEADAAYAVFFHSRDAVDLEHAFDLLDRAHRLAPGDPQTLFRWFRMALDSGQLEEATRTLTRLESLVPGDVRLAVLHALLIERRGQPHEALARLRSAVADRPSSIVRFDLASMEYRLSEVDAARATLTTLLADAPHHAAARSFLAQLELVGGDLERAAALYSDLAAALPGVAELSNLGLAQMLLGRYAEAAESLERALALAPKNPVMILNLADAVHLLGEEERALALYRQVGALTDGDGLAKGWQSLSVGAQAFAHLGRAQAAARAIQQALQLAPENPQVAYEAAMVYSLIGEPASALVNVEKASTAFGRRWFALPWFDGLRHLPEFRSALAAPPIP